MQLQYGDTLWYQGVEHTVTGFGQRGGIELTFPNGMTLRLSRRQIPRGVRLVPAPWRPQEAAK